MRNRVLLTTFLIAAILDGLLTRFALMLPGLYEGNPFARANMEMAYTIELVLVAAYIGIYGVAESYQEHRILGPLHNGMRASILFGVCLFCFAVLWNSLQIVLEI